METKILLLLFTSFNLGLNITCKPWRSIVFIFYLIYYLLYVLQLFILYSNEQMSFGHQSFYALNYKVMKVPI